MVVVDVDCHRPTSAPSSNDIHSRGTRPCEINKLCGIVLVIELLDTAYLALPEDMVMQGSDAGQRSLIDEGSMC